MRSVVPEGSGVKDAVVITDGDERPALAATRSLGARGVTVHVVASRPRSLAGVSRYATVEHVLPDPEGDPEAWAAALAALEPVRGGAPVLPVGEVSMGSLLARDEPGGPVLLAPPRDAFDLAADKHALLACAAAVGLAVPRSELVEDARALVSLPAGFRYPVILKARRSRWRAEGRWHRGGVMRIADDGALRRAGQAEDFRGGALLQEFVPGHGEGVFVLVDRGQVRVRFAHRRLREKPPSGGASVLAESREPDADLGAACDRLLADLGWHGVAMLEFRRTPEGRAVLMELNPRLWGSLQLAVDAGVDFPGLLLDLHRGVELPRVRVRAGVRTRWLLGDLDHLLVALRRREQRRTVGRSGFGVCAAFVRSFFDGTRSEVWRREDPRPFWSELRAWRP